MVMICLFKLDELSRMINNSLSQALDKIVAYESKDVIDRLNMFLVINLRFVLRFSLKRNLDQGPRSCRFY